MEELLHGLSPLRILVGMNLGIDRLLENEHMKDRGFFVHSQHPVAGDVVMPGAPFKMAATPWELRDPAPLLGQHNSDIYGGLLGHDAEEIAGWLTEGVI